MSANPLRAGVAAPLRPRALCDAIADDLRARILRGQLAPGQRIDEAALAADFDVSRTPLREALRMLCHEGLLSARPRRGMTVAVVAHDERDEASELLRLLDAHASARAAPPSALLLRLRAQLRQRLQLADGVPPAPPRLAGRVLQSSTKR